MKLIVTGATGFVGTEVLRQALRNPAITSVVAVARKHVQPPQNSGEQTNKLKSVVLEDWTAPYPEIVKEEIKDANACIWALAVTPSQSKDMDFADVTKICYDYTINGLTNMAACARKPFRFVYTSGVTIERDQSQTLHFLSDYRLMRGRTENKILEFAKEHEQVEVTVVKPGGINGPGRAVLNAAMQPVFAQFGDTPIVHVSELAVAMIDQCVNGITGDPIWAKDLVKIGKGILGEEDYLK